MQNMSAAISIQDDEINNSIFGKFCNKFEMIVINSYSSLENTIEYAIIAANYGKSIPNFDTSILF